MEKIQVQDRIETIPEIWRKYKYRIGVKLYQRYGEIQVQNWIETILEIWSKYKYRIGLKLYQRYGEKKSTG